MIRGMYQLLEFVGIILATCSAILDRPLYLIAGGVIAIYARMAQGRER